jgi:hypothetical protein
VRGGGCQGKGRHDLGLGFGGVLSVGALLPEQRLSRGGGLVIDVGLRAGVSGGPWLSTATSQVVVVHSRAVIYLSHELVDESVASVGARLDLDVLRQLMSVSSG